MSQRDLAMKSIGPVEFADDDKGEVRAVVYTLGVVDRDGDVILPKSFTGPAEVMISRYGHSAVLAHAKGAPVPVEPPVGKGRIDMNANGEVELVGRYFMSTQAGRDAYFTAKEMGPSQEWSISFWRDKGERPDAEWASKGAKRMWQTPILPFEVSPVTVAGGIGTRTLAVRSADSLDAAVDGAADAAAVEVTDGPDVAEAPTEPVTETATATGTATAAVPPPAASEAIAETKGAREQAAALKAARDEALEEYERVQRALKRMGYAA